MFLFKDCDSVVLSIHFHYGLSTKDVHPQIIHAFPHLPPLPITQFCLRRAYSLPPGGCGHLYCILLCGHVVLWWWWWFSARRQVHGLLRHPGMRGVRWFPVAFLTDKLWVSNLSKVAAQWLEVDSNLWPYGYKAQNIPLHHRVPLVVL